jgi:tetratricopeptide (TPR) repeat protein
VLTSVGVLALRMGDVVSADQALVDAATLWGERQPPAAWYLYAALAAALHSDTERAIALLAEGTETYPHAAALRNNLAVLHERVGDDGAARSELEHGLQDDPALAQLHKNTGDFLYRAGDFDEALDAYVRAVKANPMLGVDVHRKLGDIRERRNETEEARYHFERAAEIAASREAQT